MTVSSFKKGASELIARICSGFVLNWKSNEARFVADSAPEKCRSQEVEWTGHNSTPITLDLGPGKSVNQDLAPK
jgi:hypothetical protein